MRHIQAANYTAVSNREIDLLVIHATQSSEKPNASVAIANFFHNQPKGPNGSSAHYTLDSKEAVSCVWDHDVAWAAPYINHDGLHFEFVGMSEQSKRDWKDKYSEAQIFDLAVPIFAHKALRYGIPARIVEAIDLKRGHRGITAHRWATQAFGPQGGHTDPGPNFPYYDFATEVRKYKKFLRDND